MCRSKYSAISWLYLLNCLSMQSQALTMWVDAHVLVGNPSPVANIIYQCLRETVKFINMFLLIFQQAHQNVDMLIFLISATEISDSAMVLDSAHFKSSPRSCSTGSRPAGRCPSLSLTGSAFATPKNGAFSAWTSWKRGEFAKIRF